MPVILCTVVTSAIQSVVKSAVKVLKSATYPIQTVSVNTIIQCTHRAGREANGPGGVRLPLGDFTGTLGHGVSHGSARPGADR